MRKLLLAAAVVATLGLARATDEGATARPGAEPEHAAAKPAKQQKQVKAPRGKATRKHRAEPARAKPESDEPGAEKAAGGSGAAKPDAAKPCEPVKPCPIDG